MEAKGEKRGAVHVRASLTKKYWKFGVVISSCVAAMILCIVLATRRPGDQDGGDGIPDSEKGTMVIETISLSSVPDDFVVNASTYDVLLRISTEDCDATNAGFTYTLYGSNGESSFTTETSLGAHDTTYYYVKLQDGLLRVGALESVRVSLPNGAGPLSGECQISQISARVSSSTVWLTTWMDEETMSPTVAPTTKTSAPTGSRRVLFESWERRSRVRREQEGQRRLFHSRRISERRLGAPRLLWEWPSWLPWSSSTNEFNESTVDEISKTLDAARVEPEDGCFWMCDFVPAVSGKEKDAARKAGPSIPAAMLSKSSPAPIAASFQSRTTCSTSEFSGVRFSAKNVGMLLQGSQTSFDVEPHCTSVPLPRLLNLKTKWLNPISTISAYDVSASDLALDRFTFVYRPHAHNVESGADEGSVVSVRVGGVRGVARGKVVIEATNPLRDQSCSSMGCDQRGGSSWGWIADATKRAMCEAMGCDKTGLQGVLTGSATVDLADGIDVAADVTMALMPGSADTTRNAQLSIVTDIDGLDDAIDWKISSQFLSQVASAAKSALDNAGDLLNFFSVDADDIEKLVALLEAVGVDSDHTENKVSLTKFLAAMDSANIGAFVQKVAGSDLDDVQDVTDAVKIPPMPVNASCHPEAPQEKALRFDGETLERLLTHQPATFTIPSVCKSLSEETKGWVRSFQIWDLGIQDLFVRKVETSMEPSGDVTLIRAAASGISVKVSFSFLVDVWGLGEIQAVAKVDLNNYVADVTIPVQSDVEFTSARIPKEGRACELSSSKENIRISFETGSFSFGLTSIASASLSYFARNHLESLLCAKAIPNTLAELVGET